MLIALFVALGAFVYFEVFGPNARPGTNNEFLYVRTGSTYESLLEELTKTGVIKDLNGFKFVAGTLKLKDHLHPGRYRIRKGMSNYDIVRMLRSGRQEPVKLVMNKLRTSNDFIRLLSANLEADSTDFRKLLADSVFMNDLGATTVTAMAVFMPDTYEFYWNASAMQVLRKMHKSHVRFWTSVRKEKAKSQGISPMEAIIVASIVDEETNVAADKGNIASVYLNRIRKGMKLQADPTVKFAIGDFNIRRVTSAMLTYDSPYNTYMYAGLPPGPICTPTAATINAVLDAPKSSYLYFCAKDDFSGRTAFATTFEEQIRNANAYRKALDARGIH